ncbi:MAG: phosphotransferase [Alloprevotella sp.]|nr:phosphotransferase [Alloprevotella sp.]
MNESLQILYKETFRQAFAHCTPLTPSGSNRQYFRLEHTDGRTCIGVVGTSKAENHAFIYLTRHFEALHLPVPHLIAVSEDEMTYLQEDLGSCGLFDALQDGRKTGYKPTDIELLKETLRLLPHFQVEGGANIDETQLLPPTRFDFRSILFDLNYFKYCFLRTTDVVYDENLLQDDFERFATDLAHIATEGEHKYFLYRDFQARNVMLRNGKEPYFIDYQSGRIGPLQYDVASFLLQVSSKYPAPLKEELLITYLDELRTLDLTAAEKFKASFKRFSLFRLLQVLGAYGLRGRYERKKHFLHSIPLAIDTIGEYLDSKELMAYPHLRDTLKNLTNSAEFKSLKTVKSSGLLTNKPKDPPLEVEVYSFSFKKGIPTDQSGNGGGYVFDCRSTHNPGRFEQYRKQTGLDLPVINFLEEDGEILEFLDHIYPIADHHVERFIERGFSHLMFCFGCTGGQHRSVYSAQHLAKHIHAKFGVCVKLTHREIGITQTFETTGL